MTGAAGSGDGSGGPEGGSSAGGPASGSPAPPAGLCASCRHARRVTSDRGSRFVLCRRSRSEPAYPRYPRLPVLRCGGHEEEAAADGAGGGA